MRRAPRPRQASPHASPRSHPTSSKDRRADLRYLALPRLSAPRSSARRTPRTIATEVLAPGSGPVEHNNPTSRCN